MGKGIVLGRFQPFHNGHAYLVEQALARFEKVTIAIGSSQDEWTVDNPFSFEERKGMIQRWVDVNGHKESVEIEFDPLQVSIEELLYKFLRSIDVTDGQGQFCDRGDRYTTAIFPRNKAQKRAAEKAVKDASETLGKPIKTEILNFTGFYPAEVYHQDYYKSKKLVLTRFGPRKKANAYKLYRKSCGRDTRLKDLWGSDAFFKQNEG